MNDRHDRNRGPLPAPETRNRDESGSRHWRTGGSDDNVGSLSYGAEGTSARDTTPRGWYAPNEARGGEGPGEHDGRRYDDGVDSSRAEHAGPRARPRSIADFGVYDYERDGRPRARPSDGPWARDSRPYGFGVHEPRATDPRARAYAFEPHRSRDGESTEGRGNVEARFRAPKGYVRSDARIREDVCDVLGRIHGVDPTDVEVEVRDGEVTLSGTVAQRWEKHVLEDRADRVAGVKDVHNTIRVRRAGADSPTSPEPTRPMPENGATKRGPSASS